MAMMTPPDRRDRREDHHREPHHHEHLQLLDVIGVARDQRRDPESVHLAQREALDLAEDVAADGATESHRRARAVVHRHHRSDAEQR
jgi:hypothetical protein